MLSGCGALSGRVIAVSTGSIPAGTSPMLSLKFSKGEMRMNRRLIERVVLSVVCAVALLLIPVSYSWAQQEQTDPNSVNQNTQDVNRDSNNQNLNDDSNLNQDTTREKSSSPVNQQPTPQSERQDQTVSGSQTTTTESRSTSSSTSSSTSQTTNQTGESREGLPATAGELPLLALIGVLSLAAAAGARFVAKSTR
jgi:cobalamin biosynthesis Mg chelatase CobN